MLVRIITAAAALAILIPVLIFTGTIGFFILFAVISAFSVYEMLGCCGLRKNYSVSVPFIIFAALSVVSAALSSEFIRAGQTDLVRFAALISAAMAAVPVIWVVIVSVIRHESIEADRIFMFLALYIYITKGFSDLVRLRCSYGAGKAGLLIVVFVLVISWGTDTFAYFTGMAFGKRKLCPNISPKKTVAGAVGGTLLGSAAGIAVLFIALGVNTQTVVLACCSPLLSIVSQFGDLAASVIKRKFGVKDYGKLFPGHGGVLDRFDSVLAVSIVTALAVDIVYTLSL